MDHSIRGLLIGVRNVLAEKGQPNQDLLAEIIRLVLYCRSAGIEPVFFANKEWIVDTGDSRILLDKYLANELPGIRWFFATRGDCDFKPKATAVESVCSAMGWRKHEVVYLGNTDVDMRAAVNGGALFLKASWYTAGSPYGMEFGSPREVARFLDIFCRRDYLWHFKIQSDGLEFYSLAPFSTLTQRYSHYVGYSRDARSAAKFGGGHPDFWTQYLWSTLYLARIHERINFVACYPGHRVSSPPSLMEKPFSDFAGCFRKKLLPDLITRHGDARESKSVRKAGGTMSHLDQLNTICLNPTPIRSTRRGTRYVRSPLRSGKTVLVVDDFCTNGYSLEAARLNIMQTGARVICVSWLRTINADYLELVSSSTWNPYEPVKHESLPGRIRRHSYTGAIAEDQAAVEVDEKFRKFCAWRW